MPKVSIIIPTYNRGVLLHKAIDSVLAQTFSDYELIIVDDGSTDGTRDVVARYGSGKIRYIFQENKGKSAARNLGIKLADGEYIAFLDSDDMFLPSKLQLQVEVLDAHGSCGFIYSYASNVDESGNLLNYHFEGNLSGWIYPDLLLIKNNCIATPTVMVRAAVLAEIGGFDESMHICEDLDLWRRIARRYQVLQVREPLAIVRIRASERIDILQFMRARTRYYEKAIKQDPELKAIKVALYSEMYKVYLDCALHYNNKIMAAYLVAKSFLNNPIDVLMMLKQKLIK